MCGIAVARLINAELVGNHNHDMKQVHLGADVVHTASARQIVPGWSRLD